MKAKHDTKPDWVMGYTTRRHLIIDFDNTSLFKMKHLVLRIFDSYPYVGDCLILCSSTPIEQLFYYYSPKGNMKLLHVKHNYHTVFSNMISYDKACHIIEVLAELDVINKDYVNIRNMRQDMTLRVSPVVNVQKVKEKPKVMEYIKNGKVSIVEDGIKLYRILYDIM